MNVPYYLSLSLFLSLSSLQTTHVVTDRMTL